MDPVITVSMRGFAATIKPTVFRAEPNPPSDSSTSKGGPQHADLTRNPYETRGCDLKYPQGAAIG